MPLPGPVTDAFRGANILITGGLGFIGSNLAIRLVDLGANVMVVDSLIPQYGGNLYNIEPVRDRLGVNIADVRMAPTMNYLVQGRDYIFNLAGQVSHIDSMEDPYTDLEINCRAQLSILEACRRNNPGVKIVFAGTRQTYGVPDYLPVDERHLLHPTDVNGINKMAGEWYHIVYNNVYGIRSCSLRLTNTYGPRMFVKNDRHDFIGWFLRLAMHDQEIRIFGDGSQRRDMTYIDDCVDAFLIAAALEQSAGKVYNLGGLEPISLADFAQLLIGVAGTGRCTLVPFPPERKRIDIGDYYSNYDLIKAELGWEPVVPLREGLQKTIEYFRAHGDHYW
jgi:UDP-glucose 4-epimerase